VGGRYRRGLRIKRRLRDKGAVSTLPKAAREHHLLDLAVGISHGGFEILTALDNSPVRKHGSVGHLPRE
jgi:hypothetical protein